MWVTGSLRSLRRSNVTFKSSGLGDSLFPVRWHRLSRPQNSCRRHKRAHNSLLSSPSRPPPPVHPPLSPPIHPTISYPPPIFWLLCVSFLESFDRSEIKLHSGVPASLLRSHPPIPPLSLVAPCVVLLFRCAFLRGQCRWVGASWVPVCSLPGRHPAAAGGALQQVRRATWSWCHLARPFPVPFHRHLAPFHSFPLHLL